MISVKLGVCMLLTFLLLIIVIIFICVNNEKTKKIPIKTLNVMLVISFFSIPLLMSYFVIALYLIFLILTSLFTHNISKYENFLLVLALCTSPTLTFIANYNILCLIRKLILKIKNKNKSKDTNNEV